MFLNKNTAVDAVGNNLIQTAEKCNRLQCTINTKPVILNTGEKLEKKHFLGGKLKNPLLTSRIYACH
jgi:hypothetical protein